MSSMMVRFLGAALLATPLMVPGDVAAGPAVRPRIADAPDPRPKNLEARAHLAAGAKLYDLREFGKAITEFKAGALIEPAPALLYNIARAYRELGSYDEAIWFFKQIKSPVAPDALIAKARRYITEIEAIKATAPPAPKPEAATPVAPAVVERTPIAPVVPATMSRPPAPEPSAPAPWYRDTLGWGLAGVGTAAVGASGALFVVAQGKDKDANAEPVEPKRRALRDDAASDRRWAYVSLGIGGGLLLTGVVRLVLTPSSARGEGRRVGLYVSGSSFGLAGSF